MQPSSQTRVGRLPVLQWLCIMQCIMQFIVTVTCTEYIEVTLGWSIVHMAETHPWQDYLITDMSLPIALSALAYVA